MQTNSADQFLRSFLVCAAIALNAGIATATTNGPTVGQAVPEFEFEDIVGTQAKSQDYGDRIRVYTYADKDSSERLTAWMDEAGKTVLQRYPAARIAHINFADVRAVPRMFRGIVEPILRRINRNAMEDLSESYAERGLELSDDNISFHLIPDWSGAYANLFGLDGGERFIAWIESQGQIHAVLPEGTPEIESEYVRVFNQLLDADSAAPAVTESSTTVTGGP